MDIYGLLVLAGLGISILSALEHRVQWIAAFCAYFGEGCVRTEDFTLFRVPVSWWGIAYYTALGAVMAAMNSSAFYWMVMAGFGFELTFLRIMAVIRAFCIFCLLNALVVAGLAGGVFDPDRLWPSATVVLAVFVGSLYFIARENESEISGASAEESESVVAKIGGDTVITREDLEGPLTHQIYQLENEIYALKRRRLNDMIRDKLLEKEAESKGVPRSRLTGGSPEAGQEEKLKDLEARLKEKYHVDIFLEKPTLPLIEVDIQDRPAIGPADARVVVVEFSDPFCPACRSMHRTTGRIKKDYQDRIRWVFKDFPLEKHQGAGRAAEAAHCAGEQDKFWEFQDRIFSAGEDLGEKALEECAATLGLDTGSFLRCLAAGRYKPLVERDIQDGKAAGVTAVPAFIINGRLVTGTLSYEDFRRMVEDELAAANSGQGR